MESEAQTALHLPSLSITNFRAISHVSIARLGRVTLIAGPNGAGKTSAGGVLVRVEKRVSLTTAVEYSAGDLKAIANDRASGRSAIG